jgi:hypothetical protein
LSKGTEHDHLDRVHADPECFLDEGGEMDGGDGGTAAVEEVGISGGGLALQQLGPQRGKLIVYIGWHRQLQNVGISGW